MLLYVHRLCWDSDRLNCDPSHTHTSHIKNISRTGISTHLRHCWMWPVSVLLGCMFMCLPHLSHVCLVIRMFRVTLHIFSQCETISHETFLSLHSTTRQQKRAVSALKSLELNNVHHHFLQTLLACFSHPVYGSLPPAVCGEGHILCDVQDMYEIVMIYVCIIRY